MNVSMNSTDRRSQLLGPELLAQLERLELVSRKMFRGRIRGERRSRRKGQSVEFADYRNYVPGDDTRFVDWNLYARLDRLFLRLFLEEEDLHFYALIDDSESMTFGEPAKLFFAQQLAVALGFIGLCRGDRVKIEAMSAAASNASPVFRGRRSLWRMLDHVLTIEGGGSLSLARATTEFCLRNAGHGILVLITDLLDKDRYESALRQLMARPLDIYVVHVLAREELEPDLRGDLELTDCEDGDRADITVSAPLMKRYKRTLRTFLDEARSFCVRRGIGYAMVPSDESVRDVVSGLLRDQGLVR